MKPKSVPSRLFNRNSAASGDTPSLGAACKYRRHVDCVDPPERVEKYDNQPVNNNNNNSSSRQRVKSHREMHLERYEPLIDDEAQVTANEEKKKRKKEKYKKVKKNVGKALRSSWKCLMLGLYNFTLGYSTPITVAATFVPDFHRGRKGT